MPLPMTPTQLTVLTNASASASRMFPCAGSIIIAPSVVPATPHPDSRLIVSARQHPLHPDSHTFGLDADLLHQRPRELLPCEELGLPSALAVRVRVGVKPELPVQDVPIKLPHVAQVLVELARFHDGMAVAEHEGTPCVTDYLRRGLQVDDRLLAALVARHSALVDQLLHR